MPRTIAGRHRQVGRRDQRRRVVLEPGQAPGAVHPEAAQEADLADRGADIRGEARAGGEHQQHLARAARRGPTTRTRSRRRYAAPKIAQASVCHAADPHRAAETGPYHRSHASRRCAIRRSPMPVTRTSLPGVAVVAVVKRCRASRPAGAPRSWTHALDRRPPGRRQHRRHREHRQQRQRRMNRHQQRDRHAEPQDPPAGGKQRHVHVVEHEHLVAQHAEPIEILGTLVMRDGGDRRQQASRRAPRARWSPCRGSGAARAC